MLSLFKADPATTVARMLASWPEGAAPPTFTGNPKKDGRADKWLALVQKQCEERKVPQVLWPDIAKFLMSDEARGRVEEVEKIMRCVCGEKWKWDWPGFTQAVSKMGWNIDTKKTQAVKARRGPSGWWLVGRIIDDQNSKDDADTKEKAKAKDKDERKDVKKDAKDAKEAKDKPKDSAKDKDPKDKPKPDPSKCVEGKEKAKGAPLKPVDAKAAKPPKLVRSATAPPTPSNSASAFARVGSSFIAPFARAPASATPTPPAPETKPSPSSAVVPAKPMLPITPGVPIDPATIIAQVPVWLLDATDVLTTLTSQYSTSMSVLAAVLITVGSLPAMHIIGAGTAVHMLGTAAVGLGYALQERADQAKEAQLQLQQQEKTEKGKLRRLFSASAAA
ncbi:hypothetical protein OBBRIDRAFT_836816 [Obba rivulosa]|uniref:Uncharacterized protein n=1 Tax=Obba rivulosa TaxID=1052685 RepID=A0A8E2DIE4_9APHY|nr:hypothetical protein OBBRIDRAFT_836816 [Obba rivulosa]